MRVTLPPPPAIGATFRNARPTSPLFHVRAIVDVEPDGYFHVVLRFWSPARGWSYLIENAFAFRSGGTYQPAGKRARTTRKEA